MDFTFPVPLSISSNCLIDFPLLSGSCSWMLCCLPLKEEGNYLVKEGKEEYHC